MRHRLSDRLQSNIDLTSLLDVIFILLLVVMCGQKLTTGEKLSTYEQQIETLSAERDEAVIREAQASEQEELYRQQVDTFENEFTYVTSVAISVSYLPTDIKNRKLTMLVNNEEPLVITITPENAAKAYDEFTAALSEVLDQKSDIPAIVSLDTSRILYRDEKAVNGIMKNMLESHPNMYMKSGEENLYE